MSLQRKNFYRYLAQTSPTPLALEIQSAEGLYIIDTSGKRYIDLISGISVSSTGHRHPEVLAAIRKQLERHLHIMVYGEFIQEPQVKLATMLVELLPPSLTTTYFVNSGSEAVEGALKLAKRYTGRHEIIAFKMHTMAVPMAL
jgi:4-aminobutyrate aminotransferase-like enzyme